MDTKEKIPKVEKTEKKESKELLKKKRKEKGSYEKEVYLYDIFGENEYMKEKKSFKEIKEFEIYISSLKNPFTLINGIVMYLNSSKNRLIFFHTDNTKNIYQRDDNEEIYDYYKKYYYQYDNEDEHIYREYPVSLEKILLAPEFFFDQLYSKEVKLYRLDDIHLFNLIGFFGSREYNLFHLYMRRGSGTSLYFMKQMERAHEGFIYIDLRKLNNILEVNHNNVNELSDQIKKFIFYSLFNIEPIFLVNKDSFKIIEKYCYFILGKIHDVCISINGIKELSKNLLNAYIELYKTFIRQSLEIETNERYKMLIIILDHYNYEINYDYINDILKNSDDYLKFIVKHSLISEFEKNEFLQNIKDKSFIQGCEYGCVKGIEIIKNKTIIAYYEQMYPFAINNFEDEDLPALTLYKDELLANFDLINPIYIYKFLNYMKDKDQKNKSTEIFSKFLKIISTEIELNIRNYFCNSLEDEYFFLSKYYSINFEKNEEIDKKNLERVLKNLPLDYFIIKFSNNTRDILNIVPTCNLVREILLKKSRNLSSIIYQSKYYKETENQGERDNILQRAIEEKLRNDPSTLLNYVEKTLIFEMDSFIPSAKTIQSRRNDPVLEYYNSINGKNKLYNQDIVSYMSEIEKKDMKNLSDVIIKSKNIYQNIILIQKDVQGKNYDLGIIKFIENNSFVIILYQITVSREKSKFRGVNQSLEHDICYIIAKFEHFLKGYKSKGVYLIYVLDKDENITLNDKQYKEDESKKLKSQKGSKGLPKEKENSFNENIDYKNGLNKLLVNNVHLLFFGRKYLKFFTEEGKIIKEMIFVNEKISFITSEKNHYFLEETIQKIFDKIVDTFHVEIGKFFVDNYDFGDMIGNFMIITKIDKALVTVVIIIDGKKLHCFQANEKNIMQVSNNFNYNEKSSYIFEIINPEKINKISLFTSLNIDN